MTYATRRYYRKPYRSYARKPAATIAKKTPLVSLKKRTTKRKVASQLKLNPVMKTLIDRQINKHQEKHEYIWTIFNNVNMDGVITSGDIYSCAPQIGQGPNTSQYLGDECRLTYGALRLFLRCSPDLTTTNDDQAFTIRVMVFSPKKHPNAADFTTTDKVNLAGKLLKMSDDELSYDGTFFRHICAVNRTEVTLHYMRNIKVVMNKTYFYNTVVEPYGIDNVTAKPWTKELTIPLKVKDKRLTFYSAGAAYPQNFNPCIAIGFVNSRVGAQPDTNTRVNASCYAHYKWSGD